MFLNKCRNFYNWLKTINRKNTNHFKSTIFATILIIYIIRIIIRHLDNYNYNQSEDTYEDQDNNIFTFRQNVRKIKGKKWRPKRNERIEHSEIKAKIYESTLKNWEKKFIYINKITLNFLYIYFLYCRKFYIYI